MILMLILGAIIGPFMALGYPAYSISFKILLTLGLIVSIGIIIFGFKNKRHSITVTGIIFWTMIGLFYGLSTGT